MNSRLNKICQDKSLIVQEFKRWGSEVKKHKIKLLLNHIGGRVYSLKDETDKKWFAIVGFGPVASFPENWVQEVSPALAVLRYYHGLIKLVNDGVFRKSIGKNSLTPNKAHCSPRNVRDKDDS